MTEAPERIWLQDDGEWCEDAFFSGDISWCDTAINENDTEYTRTDLAEAAVAAVLEDAKDAVEAERERCAKIVEGMPDEEVVDDDGSIKWRPPYQWEIAAAIKETTK